MARRGLAHRPTHDQLRDDGAGPGTASGGAGRLAVLGYCMGAPLAACCLAREPDLPVAAFVNMAGPLDFAHAGLFGVWLDRRFFDVDRVVDTLGQMPAGMIKAGFKLLKPTMDLSTGLDLWWNLWNKDYVDGYRALSRWANGYVPTPAEFFREWVKAFHQDNRLLRGGLVYGGRPIRLEAFRCPVLAIGAKEDYIVPPASVRALVDAVGSSARSRKAPGPGCRRPAQARTADPLQVWRPFVDQGIAAWSAFISQGRVAPDMLAQWKRFLDELIAAWGKALEQAMGTEAFAQALGRHLEQWLSLQGPAHQASAQAGAGSAGEPSGAGRGEG